MKRNGYAERQGGGRGAVGAQVERHRREDRGVEGAEGCGVWEGGVPLPSPQKIFDYGSQYGEFWCILGGIFYSSAAFFHAKQEFNRYRPMRIKAVMASGGETPRGLGHCIRFEH